MTRDDNRQRARPLRALTLLGVVAVLIVAALARQHFAGDRAADQGLSGDSDEAASALAGLLTRTPVRDRLPLLVRLAQTGQPGLRYAAVDALGDHQSDAAARAIEAAFGDSSAAVRLRALDVLPRVNPDRGLRLLIAGLRDEDSCVREAAATRILLLSHQAPSAATRAAVPSLVAALGDTDDNVAVLATAALRRITGNPWYAGATAPPARRLAIRAQWRRWWAAAQPHLAIPAEFRNVVPIVPSRVDPAPDFHLDDIDGRTLSLAGQRGRITLLNFWGTWCPPCRVEIPDLAHLDRAYAGHGVDVIGIAVGEQNGAIGLRKWCAAHGVAYRQALATPAILRAYGDIQAVPISVLIDADGRIRRRWEGNRDYSTFAAAIEHTIGHVGNNS